MVNALTASQRAPVAAALVQFAKRYPETPHTSVEYGALTPRVDEDREQLLAGEDRLRQGNGDRGAGRDCASDA